MIRAGLLAGLGLSTFAAGLASAQDFYSPDIAKPGFALARIKPGARVPFYRGDDTPGCPALTARCRLRAYLVAGDLVLIGTSNGTLVEAGFTSGSGRVTIGWLPARSVQRIPTPAATPAGWQGSWSSDDAEIDIAPGPRGRLTVSGEATWGSHDPERVRRLGVNYGNFSGEAAPTGASMTIVDKDDSGCRVSLRLIGPYLLANDAMQCGGVNVTFSGIYRR